MISYTEALNLVLKETKSYGTEFIPLSQSMGRVLSENILADRDYPPFHRSAMDGFAISHKDYVKDLSYFYQRELHAGSTFTKLPGETVIRIMTGAPVPDGFDVVIKIEDAILSEKNGIKSVSFPMDGISPWQNIAKQGEDAIQNDSLLPIGTKLDISEVSLLASLGKFSVPVFSLPKVGIISTGNEVVPVDSSPLPHQIRDSNSYTIASSLFKFGIIPNFMIHVPDDEVKMKSIIKQGLDCDILILSGGVSMGEKDLVPDFLNKLGVTKIFHKIAIKPGKPVWFGKNETTLVFGLPGNPFSTQTCFRILIDPLLKSSFSQKIEQPLKFPSLTSKKKKHKLTEFYPVRFVTKEKTYLEPIEWNGSGDVKAARFSNGLAIFPSEKNQLEPEMMIQFLAW
ncbi:molybdopterin molybdenumtransferase MoeA [Leptospira biflexa]|uniref:molybdopterin molybdotransferase MoeA n=1 Tax=Leptospira biflexa TaxID=172 RepID=UPI00109151F9|nr:molybdopterin molybdotransferase MoeA [Leptospira biflexa]TGM52075.1 molybdopterin molybdenumtransferase MoeA [Leptospira biflexa]